MKNCMLHYSVFTPPLSRKTLSKLPSKEVNNLRFINSECTFCGIKLIFVKIYIENMQMRIFIDGNNFPQSKQNFPPNTYMKSSWKSFRVAWGFLQAFSFSLHPKILGDDDLNCWFVYLLWIFHIFFIFAHVCQYNLFNWTFIIQTPRNQIENIWLRLCLLSPFNRWCDRGIVHFAVDLLSALTEFINLEGWCRKFTRKAPLWLILWHLKCCFLYYFTGISQKLWNESYYEFKACMHVLTTRIQFRMKFVQKICQLWNIHRI